MTEMDSRLSSNWSEVDTPEHSERDFAAPTIKTEEERENIRPPSWNCFGHQSFPTYRHHEHNTGSFSFLRLVLQLWVVSMAFLSAAYAVQMIRAISPANQIVTTTHGGLATSVNVKKLDLRIDEVAQALLHLNTEIQILTETTVAEMNVALVNMEKHINLTHSLLHTRLDEVMNALNEMGGVSYGQGPQIVKSDDVLKEEFEDFDIIQKYLGKLSAQGRSALVTWEVKKEGKDRKVDEKKYHKLSEASSEPITYEIIFGFPVGLVLLIGSFLIFVAVWVPKSKGSSGLIE